MKSTAALEMVFCSRDRECTHHRIKILQAMFDLECEGPMTVTVDKDGTMVVWAWQERD